MAEASLKCENFRDRLWCNTIQRVFELIILMYSSYLYEEGFMSTIIEMKSKIVNVMQECL